MNNLTNCIAVVTGASEGIGKGIAQALASNGSTVAIVARSQEKLDATATELTALASSAGGAVKGFAADLTEADDVRRVMEDIKDQYGQIDILINNVGGGTFKPMHMQTAAEADLPIGIPLTAAVAASHAVIPDMIKRQSGHIVSLTSPAGYVPFPHMMPYTATRHAMVGLALSLHEELKQHGVGSTLFCPAQVNTGYFDRNDADMGWYPKVAKIFPVLEPEQVGEQVIKAIKGNKREVIYPLSLNLFLRCYQKMPRFSIAMLKLFGVWKPTAQKTS